MQASRLLILMLAAAYWAPSSSRFIDKRAAFYIANETMCIVDGEVYRRGDPVPTVDHCERCTCRPPGFSCVLRECETKPDCKSVRRAGECCPDYVCGCVHNNRLYGDGEIIDALQNACYTCKCLGSSISCTFANCLFRGDCPPEYVDGECCPRYDHCPPLRTQPPSTIFTTAAPTQPTFAQKEEDFLNFTKQHIENFATSPSSFTIQDVVSKVALTTTTSPLTTTTVHSVKFTISDDQTSSIDDFDITTLTTLLPVTTAGYKDTTKHVFPDGTTSFTTPDSDGIPTKGGEELHAAETGLSPGVTEPSTHSSKLPSDYDETTPAVHELSSTVSSTTTPEEPISIPGVMESGHDSNTSTATETAGHVLTNGTTSVTTPADDDAPTKGDVDVITVETSSSPEVTESSTPSSKLPSDYHETVSAVYEPSSTVSSTTTLDERISVSEVTEPGDDSSTSTAGNAETTGHDVFSDGTTSVATPAYDGAPTKGDVDVMSSKLSSDYDETTTVAYELSSTVSSTNAPEEPVSLSGVMETGDESKTSTAGNTEATGHDEFPDRTISVTTPASDSAPTKGDVDLITVEANVSHEVTESSITSSKLPSDYNQTSAVYELSSTVSWTTTSDEPISVPEVTEPENDSIESTASPHTFSKYKNETESTNSTEPDLKHSHTPATPEEPSTISIYEITETVHNEQENITSMASANLQDIYGNANKSANASLSDLTDVTSTVASTATPEEAISPIGISETVGNNISSTASPKSFGLDENAAKSTDAPQFDFTDTTSDPQQTDSDVVTDITISKSITDQSPSSLDTVSVDSAPSLDGLFSAVAMEVSTVSEEDALGSSPNNFSEMPEKSTNYDVASTPQPEELETLASEVSTDESPEVSPNSTTESPSFSKETTPEIIASDITATRTETPNLTTISVENNFVGTVNDTDLAAEETEVIEKSTTTKSESTTTAYETDSEEIRFGTQSPALGSISGFSENATTQDAGIELTELTAETHEITNLSVLDENEENHDIASVSAETITGAFEETMPEGDEATEIQIIKHENVFDLPNNFANDSNLSIPEFDEDGLEIKGNHAPISAGEENTAENISVHVLEGNKTIADEVLLPPESTDSNSGTDKNFSHSSVTEDHSSDAVSESHIEASSDFSHEKDSVSAETTSSGNTGSFGESKPPNREGTQTSVHENHFLGETATNDDIQDAESVMTDYSYEVTNDSDDSFPAEQESASFPVTDPTSVVSFGNDSNNSINDADEFDEGKVFESENSESTFPTTLNQSMSSSSGTLTVDETATGFQQNHDGGVKQDVTPELPINHTDSFEVDSNNTDAYHSFSTPLEQDSNVTSNSTTFSDIFNEGVHKEPELEASNNDNMAEMNFIEKIIDFNQTKIDNSKYDTVSASSTSNQTQSMKNNEEPLFNEYNLEDNPHTTLNKTTENEDGKISDMSASTEEGVESDYFEENTNIKENSVNVINEEIDGESTEKNTAHSDTSFSDFHYNHPSSTESSIPPTMQTDIMEAEMEEPSLQVHENKTFISTSDNEIGTFFTKTDENKEQQAFETNMRNTDSPVAITEDFSPTFSSMDELKIAESSNDMKLDSITMISQSEINDLNPAISKATYESINGDDSSQATESGSEVAASTELPNESSVDDVADQTEVHNLENADPINIAGEQFPLVKNETSTDADVEIFDSEEVFPGDSEDQKESEDESHIGKDNLLYENSYSTPVSESTSPDTEGDHTSISRPSDPVSSETNEGTTDADNLPSSEDKSYFHENANKSQVISVSPDTEDENHEHEAMTQNNATDASYSTFSPTEGDLIPSKTETQPVRNKPNRVNNPNTDRVFELFELISESSDHDSNNEEESSEVEGIRETDSSHLLESSHVAFVNENSATDDHDLQYENIKNSTLSSPNVAETSNEQENLKITDIAEASVSGFDTETTSDIMSLMDTFREEASVNMENEEENLENSSSIGVSKIQTLASLSDDADKKTSIGVNAHLFPDEEYIQSESESKETDVIHDTTLTDHLVHSNELPASSHKPFILEMTEIVTEASDKNEETYPTLQSESNSYPYDIHKTSNQETTTEKPSFSTVQIEVHFGKVSNNIADISGSASSLHSDSALKVEDLSSSVSSDTETPDIQNNSSSEYTEEVLHNEAAISYDTRPQKPVPMHVEPTSLSDDGSSHSTVTSRSETTTPSPDTTEVFNSEINVSGEPEDISVSETTEHQIKNSPLPNAIDSLPESPQDHPIINETSVIDFAEEINPLDYEIMSAEDETEEQNTHNRMTQNTNLQNVSLNIKEPSSLSEAIEPLSPQTALESVTYETERPEVMSESTNINNLFHSTSTSKPLTENEEVRLVSEEEIKQVNPVDVAEHTEQDDYETESTDEVRERPISAYTKSSLFLISTQSSFSEKEELVTHAGEMSEQEHSAVPLDQTTNTDIFHAEPNQSPTSEDTITFNEEKFYVHDSVVDSQDIKPAESMVLPVSDALGNEHSVTKEVHNTDISGETVRDVDNSYFSSKDEVPTADSQQIAVSENAQEIQEDTRVQPSSESTVKENIDKSNKYPSESEYLGHGNLGGIFITGRSKYNTSSLKDETGESVKENIVSEYSLGTNRTENEVTGTEIPTEIQSSFHTVSDDELTEHTSETNSMRNEPLGLVERQAGGELKEITTTAVTSTTQSNNGIPNAYKLESIPGSNLDTYLPSENLILKENVSGELEAEDAQEFNSNNNTFIPKTETTVHSGRHESETPTTSVTPLPLLVQKIRENSSLDESNELNTTSPELEMTESRSRLVNGHDAALVNDKFKPYILHPYSLTDIVSNVFKAPGYDSEVDAHLLKEKTAPRHRVKRDSYLQTANEDINVQEEDEPPILVEGFGGKPNSYFPVTSSFIVVYDESENEADNEKQKKSDSPEIDSRYAAVQLGDGSTVTMKRGIVPSDDTF